MALELKFSKFDNTPWGFRLVGGSDFDTPLTVIKVTEGSLAEEAGMQIGDTIVRVNDIATAPLTHAQAHDIISEAGNNFTMAVIRGTIDMLPEDELKSERSEISEKVEHSEKSELSVKSEHSKVSEAEKSEQSEVPAVQIAPPSPSPGDPPIVQVALPPGEDLTSEIENEIRSIIMSKQEDEKNLLRVSRARSRSPSRSRPESPAKLVRIQYSVAVEKQKLNEEIKPEMHHKEQYRREKWTTFLQKPQGPIPKPKDEPKPKPKVIDKDVSFYCVCERDPPYKVVIKRIQNVRKALKAKTYDEYSSQLTIRKEAGGDVTSTEVIDGEHSDQERPSTALSGIDADTERTDSRIGDESSVADHSEPEGEPEPEAEPEPEPVVEEPLSEVEMSMEDQLAQVQKQLLALSQLPAAIQATLDAVTQQLSKIVKNPEEEQKAQTIENDDNQTGGETEAEMETTDGEHNEHDEGTTDAEIHTADEEDEAPTRQEEEMEPIPESEPEPEPPQPEPLENLTPEEREKREKQDKIARLNASWPFKNSTMRMYRVSNCPLVPSKAIDSKRVNFLKFQPPPKNLDHLHKSEVYKMVHSMDTPAKGIAARPSVVIAADDILQHQKFQSSASGELSPQMEP